MEYITVRYENGLAKLTVHPYTEPLSLEQVQEMVGSPGQKDYIEILHRRFSDLGIVLVVAEEGRLKKMPWLATTPHPYSEPIVGDFVVLADDGGKDFTGLSLSQVEVVKKELTLGG